MTLRPYQQHAVNAAVEFLQSNYQENGVIVLPTGAGKSLVIAAIAYMLDSPVLVFQPSKEILEQNVAKLRSLGIKNIGVYSASAGSKTIGKFTFAMIGSVQRHPGYFRHFRYIIIDECHGVNTEQGMYIEFLRRHNCRVLGLTATPYRMYSHRKLGIMLQFITRMKPALFTRLLYYVQPRELATAGFLAPLQYVDVPTIDTRRLKVNASQLDYDAEALRRYMAQIKFAERVEEQLQRLLLAGMRSILVFTRFTEEAEYIAKSFGGNSAVVSATTPKDERQRILAQFRARSLHIVLNVGVLTTGFDFPALQAVILARPTMSLGLYYQMVGRAIRPCGDMRKLIVDMGGNYRKFGRVEDLEIRTAENGRRPAVFSNGRQLTNIYYK